MKRAQSPARIFAAPALIAAASLAGLVVALTGDGWRDAMAWAGLGLAVLATAWALKTRRY